MADTSFDVLIIGGEAKLAARGKVRVTKDGKAVGALTTCAAQP